MVGNWPWTASGTRSPHANDAERIVCECVVTVCDLSDAEADALTIEIVPDPARR
jgi:hypothetical protein